MKSHLYELKNYELKGDLKKYLRENRKAGKSFRGISRELSECGTSVGRSAVTDWCRQLGIK